MSLVSIRDVRKSFGANEVLKGVSLDIAKGDVVAIIGRSGSGKSTLLRCINGLETYQSGTITADGIEVGGLATNLRELRRHVGMVFQQFNLFPHLTAAENVMLAPTVVNKVSKAEARAIAAEVLAKVGLSEKMDAYPSELSGGQQQRVALARSLAMRPATAPVGIIRPSAKTVVLSQRPSPSVSSRMRILSFGTCPGSICG